MMSNKVRDDVDLRALNETPTTTHNIMDLIPTILVSSTSVPHSLQENLFFLTKI